MIARRDPEADWLPHCIMCDGRHLNSEPCVTNFQAVGAKTETDGKRPRIGTAALLPITVPEATYLKHVGDINDVKITIRIVDDFPVIYIRDSEFRSFQSALAFVQHIVNSEIPGEARP